MNRLVGLLLSAVLVFTSFKASDLNEVRAEYNTLVTNKRLCERMIAELAETKNISATHLAYLGALQTIWANHVFNPMGKLSTFNVGKKNIELAVKKEPRNVELRFIRLSVQKNAPSFLGYNSNIQEDTEFIVKNRRQVGIMIVQKNIDILLKD